MSKAITTIHLPNVRIVITKDSDPRNIQLFKDAISRYQKEVEKEKARGEA